MRATRPAGAPIYLFPSNSEHQEAELVVGHIAAAAAAGFARHDECAVLCRTNAQARLVERALVRRNVPCIVVGEGSFFDQPEVKLACACLRLALDFGGDSLALQDLLDAFGWLSAGARAAIKGEAPDLLASHLFEAQRLAALAPRDVNAARLAQHALLSLDEHRDAAPADLIDFVLADDGLGYRGRLGRARDGAARLDRLDALAGLARAHAGAQSFLDELDAMSGYDPLSVAARDRVQIMTLHSAKGLEFRLVFIVGMEDGLIPHHHAGQTERGRQEELRLAYVGLTRATDVLCLSFARQRDGRPRQPSPWLRGLPHIELRRPPDWRAMAS
jgi:DNA helicase-2/ATP-dependent DNA helicase PcrA